MNSHSSSRSLIHIAITMALSVMLYGCVVNIYQKAKSEKGYGYSALQLKGDIWRVHYTLGSRGDEMTSATKLVLWLYSCADLALSMNYAGFEITSNLRLSMTLPPSALDGEGRMEKVRDNGRDNRIYYTPDPQYSGPESMIEADVRFLKGPVQSAPPRQFNAAELKQMLDPIVNGKKCSKVKSILFPNISFSPTNVCQDEYYKKVSAYITHGATT